MPLCPRCSKPFGCTTCGDRTPQKLGATAEECPLKDGAVWVHVMDDRGMDVPDVAAAMDSNGTPTGPHGTAVFDPVKSGSYAVALDRLGSSGLDLYEDFADTQRTVTVAPGQIAYVPYQLVRKPSLAVRVEKKADPRKLFGRATVAADGPEPKKQDTVDDESGLADFGPVKAGAYTITVTLDAKHKDDFATTLDFTTTTEPVTLGPGQQRVVVIAVEAINVVTPKVEIDKDVLHIDHGPESRELSVAAVKLSLTQTNLTHRYEDAITLKCASETDVEAFTDKACTEGKRLAGSLTAGIALTGQVADDLRTGKAVEVFFRGNTTDGALTISLELEKPTDRFVRLEKPSESVEAKIELLARPHVTIVWFDDSGGVDDVKVKLDADGNTHDIPDSAGGGFAKWAQRGIKPGLYNCALSFPGNINYLLHDAEGRPVANPSLDLKPGGPAVTFKIRKAQVKLSVTCETVGPAEIVKAQVKLKSIGNKVALETGKDPVPVAIPVIEVDQTCEIETFTPDGDGAYEMVEVD